MTYTRQLVVQAILPALLLVGCQETGLENLFDESSAGVRTVYEVAYDTVWQYGGIDDTVFAVPKALAATEAGALYVLDAQTSRVVRFSPRGVIDWAWGAKGEGPGEVMNVQAIDATPDGGVVLADSGNCRLVFLSAAGVLVEERSLRCDFSLIEGVAVLSSGDIVLDTNGDAPWSLATDSEYTDLPVPWTGFLEMPFLQRYGNVVSWGDDGWVFGFETGNGWFVWRRGRELATFPYVEHTPFPEVTISRRSGDGVVTTITRMVTRPPLSAYAIDAWMDTLYVLPGGVTKHRRRVLDKYSIPDGRYQHSVGLPGMGTANYIAVVGGTVFIIEAQDYFPYITALRYRRGDNG